MALLKALKWSDVQCNCVKLPLKAVSPLFFLCWNVTNNCTQHAIFSIDVLLNYKEPSHKLLRKTFPLPSCLCKQQQVSRIFQHFTAAYELKLAFSFRKNYNLTRSRCHLSGKFMTFLRKCNKQSARCNMMHSHARKSFVMTKCELLIKYMKSCLEHSLLLLRERKTFLSASMAQFFQQTFA